MKDIYITVTGFNHYYGKKPFSIGKRLRCSKEPDNAFDNEAIKVTMKEIGTVGYVANSPQTKADGTQSAGRIYDKVPHRFFAEVMFMTGSKIICRVLPEKEQQSRRNSYSRCVDNVPFYGPDEPVPF